MFGLSPVFGLLADRVGREFTIAVGQVLLLIALLVTAAGAESDVVVTIGLVLIGLGWSASTVAGSTLVAQSADLTHRTRIQGRADLLQSATGALGGAAAGLVLSLLGYSGLALVAISLVAAVLATLIYRVFVVRRAAVPAG
jgi:MFS family permease